MGWILFDIIEIDVVKLAPTVLKSAAGAVGGGVAGLLFRKVKGWIMLVSERCMVEGCGAAAAHEAVHRGLCLKCYSRAKKKVEAGETTWEELAALGMCRGEAVDPFDKQYQKAKQDKFVEQYGKPREDE